MSLSLAGNTPASTFNKLLVINNTNLNSVTGLDDTLRLITDGSGLATPIQLSLTQIALNNVLWPTSGNTAGSYLQVSTNTGQLQWHTLNNPDVVAALGYTPANVANAIFTAPITIKGAVYDTVTTKVTDTNIDTVYTFKTTLGGTMKLLCQVQDLTTKAYQSEEILIVTDSSIVDMTSYGVVGTQNVLGVFNASMSGTNVLVTFQAAIASNKTVTVVVTAVTGASS